MAPLQTMEIKDRVLPDYKKDSERAHNREASAAKKGNRRPNKATTDMDGKWLPMQKLHQRIERWSL